MTQCSPGMSPQQSMLYEYVSWLGPVATFTLLVLVYVPYIVWGPGHNHSYCNVRQTTT